MEYELDPNPAIKVRPSIGFEKIPLWNPFVSRPKPGVIALPESTFPPSAQFPTLVEPACVFECGGTGTDAESAGLKLAHIV